MCTLIVMRDLFRFYPLVVAANRDEDLSRPSSPPEFRSEGVRVLAPKDEKAGGTWIAVSETGVMAAVTNRDDVAARDAPLSRGELPLMAAEARDAEAAARRLSGIDATLWNGFRLVVADPFRTFLLEGNGVTISCEELGAGLTVVTEIGRAHVEDPGRSAHLLTPRRVARVAMRFSNDAGRGPPRPSGLSCLLDLHDHHEPKDATCRHARGTGWATRSSTVVRLDDERVAYDLWHREARPDGGVCGQRWTGPTRVILDREK